MRQRKSGKGSGNASRATGFQGLLTWKLEDAKARLSEVVRLADTRGPQMVTVRGRNAAVILSPREFEQMRPAKKQQPLVDFLQELRLSDIPLTRERDTGRDIPL